MPPPVIGDEPADDDRWGLVQPFPHDFSGALDRAPWGAATSPARSHLVELSRHVQVALGGQADDGSSLF